MIKDTSISPHAQLLFSVVVFRLTIERMLQGGKRFRSAILQTQMLRMVLEVFPCAYVLKYSTSTQV